MKPSKLIVMLTAMELFGPHTDPRILRGGEVFVSVSRACAVCATFQNGQTFITWPDEATGSAGNNWRYSVYRSTSPIASSNYRSATLIASHVFNNSGQLFGGNPDTGGAEFNQTNRQDPTQPMAVLNYGGTPLAYGTGLQVYTALATQSAYYAVVANPQPSGSDEYIGSVGPVSESVATIQPIKYADSLTRSSCSVPGFKITSPKGLPIVFTAHASNASGGPPPGYPECGDYWEWFMTPAEGYQDGRATTMSVKQDGLNFLTTSLKITPRDTWWSTDGTSGFETFHQGPGMTPNPLVGRANRMYLSTANGYAKMLDFAIAHYGGDINQIHWTGYSMGAWGGANTGMRIVPAIDALWLESPVWRMDHRSVWTQLTGPFAATLPRNASAVQLPDGQQWGGAGGYVDMPTFIAASPGSDLPMISWAISQNDPYGLWPDSLAALSAMKSAKRGFVFAWAEGQHDTDGGYAAVDCDHGSKAYGGCYQKSWFRKNLSYPTFTNNSIDDNPGTGATNAKGMYNGDFSGCINCGFHWSIATNSPTTWAAAIGNSWMTRAASAAPTTTTTGPIAGSGNGTVGLTSATGFYTNDGANPYFLIDSEAIEGTISGTTLTIIARARLGTTAASHLTGATIRQFIANPSGPNGGPVSSMTVDVTPRRLQNFSPAIGATVNCTVTPNGGSPSVISPVVDSNGLFTIVGFPINASGDTSVSCNAASREPIHRRSAAGRR